MHAHKGTRQQRAVGTQHTRRALTRMYTRSHAHTGTRTRAHGHGQRGVARPDACVRACAVAQAAAWLPCDGPRAGPACAQVRRDRYRRRADCCGRP
eukprot:4591774-Prymnesium_polylepis.1